VHPNVFLTHKRLAALPSCVWALWHVVSACNTAKEPSDVITGGVTHAFEFLTVDCVSSRERTTPGVKSGRAMLRLKTYATRKHHDVEPIAGGGDETAPGRSIDEACCRYIS